MDNVFCEKCTFCKERERLCSWFDDVEYKDGVSVRWSLTDVCTYDAEEEVITTVNSRTTYKCKKIKVDRLTKFNRNNKCEHYKKKWWLLWME